MALRNCHMMHNGWGNVQYTVHSIDPEKRLITFERGGYQHGRSGGAAPIFLENQLELLDAPGEWYQIRMVTHAHRFRRLKVLTNPCPRRHPGGTSQPHY
eukprot:COSAG01_NODE_23257_length_822_cov_0.663900_1_plen_99_part_00